MLYKKILCLLLVLVPLNRGAGDEISQTASSPSFLGSAVTNLRAAAGALRNEVAAIMERSSRAHAMPPTPVATRRTAAAVAPAAGSLPRSADTFRLAMFGFISMAAAMLLRLRTPRNCNRKVSRKDLGLRPFPREV